MLHIDSYEEIIDIMIDYLQDEDSICASYVANEETIRELMRTIAINTAILPDMIEFNTEEEGYYYLTIDYNEYDDEYTYSICNAQSDDGTFLASDGFVMVDEEVPHKFEKDVSKNKYLFMNPARVTWGDSEEEDEEYPECKECTYNCKESCCVGHKNEQLEIKHDEDGNINGFSKTWKNNNSYYSFSFKSSNEDDVIEMMNRLGINE